MSVRLLALFRRPEDPEAFERHYWDVHIPIVRQMPGLRRIEVHRVAQALGDSDLYQVAELVFDDREALEAAMRSEAGRAGGRDLRQFAGDRVLLVVAETRVVGGGEEDGR